MPIDAGQRADLWRAYREGDPEAASRFADLLRESYANVGRGDIDAVLEGFDEDALLVPAAQAPESDPIRGHDGIRGWYEDFLAAWEVRLEPLEVHPAGDSVVVVVGIELVSRAGGVPLRERSGDLVTFDEGTGRVVRWQVFTDPAEALAAAGL